MATTKKYDVSIKVGSYTDGQGNERNRYKTIGAMWEKDDGGTYLALDSTIVTMELQYIANPKRSERLICSLFEPRENGDRPASRPAPAKQEPQQGKPKADVQDMDDDIPF